MCRGYHVLTCHRFLVPKQSRVATFKSQRYAYLVTVTRSRSGYKIQDFQDSGLLKVKLTKELESLYSSEAVGLVESVAFPHSIYC